ncbi:MAG: M20/M25/M40 family metallo-hydrolase [Acidobacteriota bacterium]
MAEAQRSNPAGPIAGARPACWGHSRWRQLGGAILLLLVGLLCARPAPAADEPPALAAAREYRSVHGSEILRELAELVRLPNVAADRPAIRRNAAFLETALTRRGLAAEVIELADAAPIVFAELETPGAQRTLLFYAHYDGQPVDPDQWRHGAWEPTLYSAAMEAGGRPFRWPSAEEEIDPDWRLYGRSTADDKAPIIALLAALDALAAAGLEASVNLKVLLEGEEEAGSPHLARYLDHLGERLAGDLWLFCDGPVHQSGRPQLFFGVRGFSGLEITVYGANRSLHSGHYGNWAPNPSERLVHLLASMKDEAGRVTVEGFYDSVVPIGEAERQALDEVPEFEATLRHALGLAESVGEERYNERLLLPSLNLRGLAGATVGATARNVIPSQATASIDLRLVLGNDPDELAQKVEDHIRRQGYTIVREAPDDETRRAHPRLARVVRQGGYRAVRTAMDLPAVSDLVAAATAAAGEPVVRVPTLGGSLPLYLFEGRPLIGVPIANHDNNQHAPNENLRLGNLWYGVDLMALLLTLPPAGAE